MVVEKAYAKLNFGLEVERKREDSYHDLVMVMISISLSDELYFEEIPNNKIIIDCEKMNHIPLEDNLIYKTALYLKAKHNISKGVKIRVVKNIPERAGLGGGSADAAAAFRGLNLLWSLGLGLEDLAKYAIDIGSDVPFCIYNKTAKVSGRGDVIEFLPNIPYLNLILVLPPFKVSTADVFSSFKVHRINQGKTNKLIKGIVNKDIDEISDNLFNDLEYSYFYKEIAKVKTDLITSGARAASMTGSGSTVYGICLNEKDAVKVNNKFLQNNKTMTTIFAQTRSNIKYIWSGQARQQIKYKTLEVAKTKAYGYISLVHQSIDNNYITIKTPLVLYNEVFIEKVNTKISEVYINEYLEENQLTNYLSKLVDNLDYGLRIKIKESFVKGFNLINFENYLASIIAALSDFGEDSSKLFTLYNNKVNSYKDHKVFYYESKTDKLEYLNNIPFGYVLLADLGIKDYKNPRYTKQIEKASEIQLMLNAIKEKNFYEVAASLYNSLERFEIRNIEANSQLKYNKLKNDCLKFGAQGFVLGLDGKYIVCFARFEKHLKTLNNILKNFHNLRKTIFTSIKSNVPHHFSTSQVFKEIEKEEIKDQIIFDVDLASKDEYSKYDYNDYTNPFDNESIDLSLEETKAIKSRVRKSGQKPKNMPKDIEGILHIHSGGSLFKLYDFKEIAKYFLEYYNDKKINFKIDEEILSVRFKIDNLPHLVGLHKIDVDDDTYRGSKGASKLLSGEITYQKLKNTLDSKVFDQIIKRIQGLVLIFNDFYHGKDDELICYDKEIISKDESKLKDKLKYGITRGVAGNQFHTRNVLGIGYEEGNSNNYFITSFLWDAQASLGKKEGYKVEIVKG